MSDSKIGIGRQKIYIVENINKLEKKDRVKALTIIANGMLVNPPDLPRALTEKHEKSDGMSIPFRILNETLIESLYTHIYKTLKGEEDELIALLSEPTF